MSRRKSSINSQSANIELFSRPGGISFRKSQVNTKPTINSFNPVDRLNTTLKVKTNYQSDYDNFTQTDRRVSKLSSVSAVKRFKKNFTHHKVLRPQIRQIKQNYDIWDLTYTLLQSKMKTWISALWFFTFFAVRAYAFCCCIYISTNSVHVEWLIPFALVRLIFFILVIKISLNDPATRTQVVLKTHWNSIENNTKEYFEVMSLKKLGTSILRGLIPAQFSFLYIKSESIKKKYEIFTAINFIFISMEEIIFYPFFIIYCSYLVKEKTFEYDVSYEIATIIIISCKFFVFIILSVYLLLLGIKKKYGGIINCYKYHRNHIQLNKIQYNDIDNDNRSVIS